MLLIKNVSLYRDRQAQKTHILIGGKRILAIDPDLSGPFPVFNGENLIALPGLIDNHVHVTGGGGEAGFFSRAPEVQARDLLENGITTVLGLLGTDSYTRSIENLVAKLYGLREQHLSAYGFTGSYRFPSPTLTGDVGKDIAFIDPIIGVKIALSDHRASHIDTSELTRLAATARTAGMVSKKAGIVVVHLGDGKNGLQPLIDIAENTEIPIGQFQPTHINRNPALLEQGLRFLSLGGSIDLTCRSHPEQTPAAIITDLLDSDLNRDKITISSDGNGSYSRYDDEGHLTAIGVAHVDALYEEFRRLAEIIGIPAALPYFTTNVATKFRLPKKGALRPDYDADILLCDENLMLRHVFSKGVHVVSNGSLNEKTVLTF